MRYFLATILVSLPLAAQPSVTAVQDAGAYTANLAQGSVFVVKGTGLSAAGTVTATAPTYPATLNNVSISLTPTAGGAAITAPMIYTFNASNVNQLAALLPSSAPLGQYDLRVSNGGATSAPFRTTVVARKPGIVTVSSDGSGAAQATLEGGLILARNTNQGNIAQFTTRPARPGDRVDLWGTGLGADPASDNGGTSGNLAAAQVRVYLNGQEITPDYAGRSSGLPGLDQIVFTLPNAIALNCQVVVQVAATGVFSNTVTLPTSNGGACPAATTIRINEVESNGGTPGDWVELYNAGSAPFDLSGYVFKDNDDSRTFAVPSNTIVAPGAYYLLEEAAFNFGLGAPDAARLYRPDGSLAESYFWTSHAAITYGRCPNGAGALTANSISTKGAANDCGSPIRINEIESSGGTPGDWIELINPTASAIDVSGFLMRDNDDSRAYTLPAGSTVPANGYLVIEEAQLGFGLGEADSARLFDRSGAVVDSYSWTAHAASTYGRCPNGTGAFLNTAASTKAAANACPGDVSFAPWPAANAAVIVADNPNTFNGNLSGLHMTANGRLWAVRNGPGTLFQLMLNATTAKFEPVASDSWAAGKALRYSNGSGDPDSEGVVMVDSFAYVSTERDNAVNNVSRNSILRFNTAGNATTLAATHEWNITADLPAVGPNLGLEAISFVPDSYLTSQNFFDESKNRAYNPNDYPDHAGGLFFVALEANGIVYAYALNHTTNTATRIATIESGLAGVMDLHFDTTFGDLWAVCDNTCNGRSVVLRIGSTGRFTVSKRYERPVNMPNLNNEGFAITPNNLCSNGNRLAFWADDSETDGQALRASLVACTAAP